jgi:hypothetical protein
VLRINASLLIAAGATSFVLKQKKQKFIQQRGFFAARGLYPASVQNHGLETLCTTSPAAASAQDSAMPLQPHKATIVLPASARSFFADNKKK